MSRDALVVGINNYKSDVLPHLNAPYHDAEAIATRLETDGDFQVCRMPEAIDRKTNKPFVGKTFNVSLSQLQAALVKLFKPDGDYIPETASGSGKSSVLRAGLLYELQQGRKITASQDWKVQVIVPTDSPMNSLALSFLNPDDDEIARARKLDEVETLLKKGASGLSKLIQATKSKRFVLVIDQFEEIFTLVQGEDSQAIREDFLQCVFGALKENPDKLCLIVAMRADFLLKCLEAEYSGLAQQIEANLITVTPMNEKEEKVRKILADEFLRRI